MFTHHYSEAELADRQFRSSIPPKWEPYYIILAWGRAIGYRRTPKCGGAVGRQDQGGRSTGMSLSGS